MITNLSPSQENLREKKADQEGMKMMNLSESQEKFMIGEKRRGQEGMMGMNLSQSQE